MNRGICMDNNFPESEICCCWNKFILLLSGSRVINEVIGDIDDNEDRDDIGVMLDSDGIW